MITNTGPDMDPSDPLVTSGLYRPKVTMNADTDYVHTHIVNYEPTYRALMWAAESWRNGVGDGIAEFRDALADVVEIELAGTGLNPEDLTDDVDYAVMIQWEVENGD